MILGLMQTYNGQKYIRKALASLAAACDKVVVLDDGSTDETPRILRALTRECKISWVTSMPPQGHEWTSGDGCNRNLMLRMADRYSPEFCLSLDDDEEFEDPQAIRGCLLTCCPEALVLSLVHLWDREDQARVRSVREGGVLDRLRGWRWRSGEVIGVTHHLHGGSAPHRNKSEWNVRHDLRIIHWGLFDSRDRAEKYEMYRRVDPGGIWNRGGYESLIQPIGLEPFHRKVI